VTSSRALSALAHGASAVFLVAEVTAWLTGLWPATPLTFAVSLVVVAIGPLVGMLHVATADEPRPALAPAPPRRPAPRPLPAPAPAVPPRLAAARRFHAWRDGDAAVPARR
jgi:hypothetical protein